MKKWKDGECAFCYRMVDTNGSQVSDDPKTVATYLRVQAFDAFRAEEYEISAALGVAATCINEDARNNHAPRWKEAVRILKTVKDR